MFKLFVISCLIILVNGKVYFSKSNSDGRIVGGVEIDISKVPYQISLQKSKKHICGGSLIAKNWVMTAAHCTNGQNISNLSVRIGSSKHASGGIIVQAKKIHQHPSYNPRNVDYDYSLLELDNWDENEITFGFVSLPEEGAEVPNDDFVQISGWGLTKNSQESRDVLRWVEVPKVNQQTCSNDYSRYGGITDRMFCAGLRQGGKDSCQGDSGGPLTYKGELRGIVSWGNGCAAPNYPGVYAKVSVVRPWIKQISGI